jgi:hypothetical protein
MRLAMKPQNLARGGSGAQVAKSVARVDLKQNSKGSPLIDKIRMLYTVFNIHVNFIHIFTY